MVTADQIITLVDAIAAADGPEAVVLFGSYAYGTPTGDSDVDLLVIREYDRANPHVGVEIRMKVEATFPVDLIVRSRGEIARRVAQNDWFLKDATEQGITLYAAGDDGVGREGPDRLRHHLGVAAAIAGDAGPVGADLLPRPAVHGEIPQGAAG